VSGTYGPMSELKNQPLTKSLGPFFKVKWFKTTNNRFLLCQQKTRETQTRCELSWGEAISMKAIWGWTNRPTDQQTNRPKDQQTNRPTDQQTNRPTDQQNNRPTKQRTDKVFYRGAMLVPKKLQSKMSIHLQLAAIFKWFQLCRRLGLGSYFYSFQALFKSY
jgi:hypothetical protein